MPDISLQHIFAITLLDGDLSFEAAHSFERMKDPRVLEVKARVALVAEPEVERVPPQRHSVVEVTTRDGRRLQKRVTTFRGNEDNPLSTEEVERKALDLLGTVLGAQRSRQLIDAVGRLESLPSIRELLPLLEA
jgi:2-methylcitrate dehydratase PrpD